MRTSLVGLCWYRLAKEAEGGRGGGGRVEHLSRITLTCDQAIFFFFGGEKKIVYFNVLKTPISKHMFREFVSNKW